MKNSEQHDLEKLLKDNLSDKTAHVPDFVWDNIEEELFPKKRRRVFFWFFFCGIGLIAGLSSLYLFSGNPNTSRQLVHNEMGYEKQSESEKRDEERSWSLLAENKELNQKQGPEAGFRSPGNRNEGEWSKKIEQDKGKLNAKSSFPRSKTGEGEGAGLRGKSNSKYTVGPTIDLPRNQQGTSISNPGGNVSKGVPGKKTPGKSGGPTDKASNLLPGQHEQPIASSSEGTRVNNETTINDKNELATTNQTGKKDSIAAQTEPEAEKEPEMAAATDTLTNIASVQDTAKPVEKSTRFAINVYGGTTLYDLAVIKDYFSSGQLSRRPFKSGGFEVGVGFSYQISPKLGMYSQVSFNRKTTSFNYNLAITEADYFNHYSIGELIPLENIEDDGANSCFLAKDVIAEYKLDSWIFSLGATYQLLQWKKFTLGADLRFSGNLGSKLQLDELTVIQVQSFENERFNYFKMGGGLNLDYRISDTISLGIAPMFHWQFNPDKQSFYKGKLKELVLPLSVAFHF